MALNFALAMVLVAVTAYTDATRGKIYNIHTLPIFGVGLVMAIIQGRYDLIVSAVIVFGFYYIIYGFPRLISRIAMSFGALPLPEGKRAMAGGDVKLATALAVLVGHIPVLYGTALASLLMILYYGVRAWEVAGSFTAMALRVTGKRGHTSAAFGPFLGPCTVAMAVLFNYY